MKKAILFIVVATIAGLAFMAGRTTRPPQAPNAGAEAGVADAPVEPKMEPGGGKAAPVHIVVNPAGEPVVIAPATEQIGTTVPMSADPVFAPLASPVAGRPRPMIIPVRGVQASALHDMFNEVRGNKRHEAIDILAPRGTPVIATDDGFVKKLFTSNAGGLTVYEFDPDQRYCYYYAHLDAYASGLHEGQILKRGELVGYVGTTGNAPKDTPHLHFALILLEQPERRWWKGSYVNPYPILASN